MMADEIDPDTCVGSKRRVAEIEEALFLQQPSTCLSMVPTQEDSKDSQSLVLSSPEEEQVITQDIPSPSSFKKVRCSFYNSGDRGPVVGFESHGEKNIGSLVEEKANLCDFVTGFLETERTSEDFLGKVETFVVKMKETETSVTGLESNQRKVETESPEDMPEETKTDSDNVELDGDNKEVEMVSVVEENNKSSILEENLLEAKKKQLLAELEAGSIFKDNAHVENIHGLDEGILWSVKGIGDSVRSSLKFEVIDDTALIEPIPAAENGNGGVEVVEKNGKKNVKLETEAKKGKRPRRKGKGVKKVFEISGVQEKAIQVVEAQNGNGGKGDGMKKRHSRENLEALRFVNIVEQRKLWKDIYTGLGDAVMKEYDGLGNSKHQKNARLSVYPRQHFGRSYNTPSIPGEGSLENVGTELEHMEDELENVNDLDPACGHSVWGGSACPVTEGECSEEDDSDEDYASIQRPAFFVDGDPDFESGPPEDGLEYLRRVRWEAAHIPKVKVAKLDRSKISKEQSVYMPQIPDVAKCAEHLLPLRQWEDAFLADFSELRLLLSRYEDSNAIISYKLQSMTIVHKENVSSPQLTESVILEKFNDFGSNEVHSNGPIDTYTLENTVDQPSIEDVEDGKTFKSSPNLTIDGSCNYPTLSMILGMDCVARVSKLREHIRTAETMSTLTKNHAVWLFALCAAVDTPLDADTCASIRSLLRKCASLRAAKSELDDEVVMLNILATIAGRYFGQSES